MSSARGTPIPVYPLPLAAQRPVPRPSHLSPIYPAHFPSHLSPPPLCSSRQHYPFTDNTLNSSIPQTSPFFPATPLKKTASSSTGRRRIICINLCSCRIGMPQHRLHRVDIRAAADQMCAATGKWPDLKHPTYFNEKLQWMKIHEDYTKYRDYADKIKAVSYTHLDVYKRQSIFIAAVRTSYSRTMRTKYHRASAATAFPLHITGCTTDI